MTEAEARDLYLGEWRADKKAEELAEEYHARTEAFDRVVCSGPIRDGSILPVGPREAGLSSENAIKTREYVLSKADALGVPRREVLAAIRRLA